jgi:hypothetical protein
MTVVRITNPPITVRVGTPLAPRVTSSATFVGSSANLVNEINYAVDLAEQASATANAAAANVNSKLSKSGDTMTGSLILSGGGTNLKFSGGSALIGNDSNNIVSLVANNLIGDTAVSVQEGDGGLAQVYSNGRVEIITDTGGAGALWTFGKDSSLGLPGNVIPAVANTSNLGSQNKPFNEIYGTIVTVNGGTF